jgi:hypothetical protein
MRLDMRHAVLVATATLLVVGSAGCGGSAAPAPSSAPPTPTASSAPPLPEPSVAEVPPVDDPGATPSPGVVRVQPGVRRLTAADVFDLGNWEEKSHQVAGRPAGTALGVTLSCGATAQFELRLANKFRSLSLGLGQDDNSDSSQEILEFAVTGNGRTLDTVVVPFNALRTTTVDVRGVNAVVVSVQPDRRRDCHGGVTPVVSDLTITALN